MKFLFVYNIWFINYILKCDNNENLYILFTSMIFYFIEKNYISKKVKYGWDDKNKEGYNSLYLLEKFLIKNGIEKNSFDKNLKGEFDLNNNYRIL